MDNFGVKYEKIALTAVRGTRGAKKRYGVSRVVIRRITPRGTAYLSPTHVRRAYARARARARVSAHVGVGAFFI